ncbi:hypothetical protein DXG01_016126 [Tephrocybe rancida]|nr:hypothetical protein DXG01_016126 [Tephrocybe rancida]
MLYSSPAGTTITERTSKIHPVPAPLQPTRNQTLFEFSPLSPRIAAIVAPLGQSCGSIPGQGESWTFDFGQNSPRSDTSSTTSTESVSPDPVSPAPTSDTSQRSSTGSGASSAVKGYSTITINHETTPRNDPDVPTSALSHSEFHSSIQENKHGKATHGGDGRTEKLFEIVSFEGVVGTSRDDHPTITPGLAAVNNGLQEEDSHISTLQGVRQCPTATYAEAPITPVVGEGLDSDRAVVGDVLKKGEPHISSSEEVDKGSKVKDLDTDVLEMEPYSTSTARQLSKAKTLDTLEGHISGTDLKKHAIDEHWANQTLPQDPFATSQLPYLRDPDVDADFNMFRQLVKHLNELQPQQCYSLPSDPGELANLLIKGQDSRQRRRALPAFLPPRPPSPQKGEPERPAGPGWREIMSTHPDYNHLLVKRVGWLEQMVQHYTIAELKETTTEVTVRAVATGHAHVLNVEAAATAPVRITMDSELDLLTSAID